MTQQDQAQAPTIPAHGAVIEVPLNKLKASPRNARWTPHGEAAIGALAASIAVKGLLQAPVVEPELRDGEPTGAWLVTIGEGRRQALRLLAKRKTIAKTHPIRCVVDIANDPHEISLDENVTRSEMHPADQFEAFKKLADERGLSAEDIAARFGVSAQVVRQRLRLAAVSPNLMAAYREGELTLEVLMAFAVSEDHARQEQVFEQLTWNRTARNVRLAMTEAKVPASDRRAVFVGVEAYAQAGGAILRDLFTEDGGGWLEDVGLLDRLAAEKLAGVAENVRAREGWKWAEAHLDYPHGHGFSRAYPSPVVRTPEQEAEIAALSEEYDALVDQWDAVEELPPEVDARFKEIDAALEAFGDSAAYDPEDIARGGVFVILGYEGQVRYERGLIRPEDMAPEPEVEVEGADDGDKGGRQEAERTADGPPEPDEAEDAPLSERLVLNLTAHRTAGLRDALAQAPDLALVAVVHALAVAAFYPHERASCLDLKTVSAWLGNPAPGIEESPAGLAIAARHEAWAVRLPRAAADAWGFVAALSGEELLALLAHCASLTVNAVRNPLDRRPLALAHADALARDVGLDMTTYWSASARSYLAHVTKGKIMEAVGEGASAEAAERMAGFKKPHMVEAAEQALAGTSWLPRLLRTPQAPQEHAAVPLAAE